MPYTTELHERHLDRLDLTQDDVEAYLTTEYGMDGFTLEKQNDVYIISAPGEVELVRFKIALKILSPWCSPQTNIPLYYTNSLMSDIIRE